MSDTETLYFNIRFREKDSDKDTHVCIQTNIGDEVKLKDVYQKLHRVSVITIRQITKRTFDKIKSKRRK